MRVSRLLALALTMLFVAAACSDSGSDGASGDTAKTTIKLVENPWTASALDAAVAAHLIRDELGYTVEVVKIDENTMFTGLSTGDLSAVLEIWPSGITPDEQAYFDEGSVDNLGELGTIGKIGWFVPDYVIAEHPDLATWEGYKDPANAALFATAETGSKGRFLGTDPSYSQYDQQIITNLDLPFEVVFSGSEPATVAEVDTKVANNEPIVLYWWTPTAAVAKYKLVNVALPAYTPDCYAVEADIACDYPEDVLIKAAWSGLADQAPDVYSFLQKFKLTTEDQLTMLPAVEIDGREASDVAAEWIANNEAVWKAWL